MSQQECSQRLSSDLIESQFQKKFTFIRQADWKLPESKTLFTQDAFLDTCLQKQKERLNGVKSKLNDLELEPWSTHTSTQSPSSVIIPKIKETFVAEFVTQAWTKFYECLSSFPLIPKNSPQSLNTLHLCEAPGAFVVALNHFLKTHTEIENWTWCATTLNTYYEGNSFGSMIADDRFMYTTLENWEFGADYTGDITSGKNVDQLVERCSKMGQIDLITADGSVNCTNTPDCQEEIVSHLHYAETVTALRILSLNGNFVLKMFTFFESSSVCLLYLLVYIFKTVTVFKPVTSREGNSEVYVICQNLETRPSQEFLEKMFKNMSNHDTSLFPEATIPQTFFQQLYNCMDMFADLQINVIERNLATYDPRDIKKISPETEQLIQVVFIEFCRRFKLENLPENARITIPNALPNFWRESPRISEGSYTDRVINKCKNDQQILDTHRKRYKRYEESIVTCNNHNFLRCCSTCSISPIYGKRFRKISYSVFVSSGLYHYFLDMARDCVDYSKEDNSPNCRTERRGSLVLIEMKNFCRVHDHSEYFHDTVIEMRNALKLPDIQKIILVNFCPLSQLSAGLVFLLAMERQSRIQLKCHLGEISIDVSSKYIRETYSNILEIIENLLEKEDSDSILLSLVDIRDIYGNFSYTRLIRCFNNHLVMKMFRDLLAN
ncbi:cap-specific mRNA (nucleoside-2'-O-)-methyltransferase 2 [Phlebotomus papatasi]|uniref:cap-specific mRNA (nucleoside-2'-O-)-methyltransferase 2 n=1 Tax=Phlebotomus papatasi TaxID=29031 RepID=UPI002483A7E5|nr:cap-specific mRNA (nucleoside-2'-O-)-methyltransferase 2 [Phlebotomus papatasi]